MSCRKPLLSCIVFTLSAAVAEAEAATQTATNRLPEVLVTSTRLALAPEETPASVTVLQGEQLAARQVVRVEDALREVPGLEVVQTGQPGAQTTVFLRGSERDQTLVLIDGIPVNSGFDNAFDFAHLPISNIERIEVVRGPQSVLYGSEAIGGVINIVTRRGTGKPTGSALVEGGTWDSFHTREQFSGSFGPLSLAVGGGYFTTDNERPNSFYRRRDVSGNATYQALDRLSLSLLGTYLNSKNGVPDSKFVNDPNDYQRDEQSLVALTIDGQPIEAWDSTLKLSFRKNRLEANGPADPELLFDWAFLVDIDTERLYADWQNVFRLAPEHRVLVGGTVDDVVSQYDDGFAVFRRTETALAAYGQYEFAPSDRLTLTAGGRVDDSNRYGTHGTYRFGGRYTTPQTETILRASLGSGFRAPTFLELYYPFFSNPNLEPETSVGWDAGFEQPLPQWQLSFGATYFQNEYDDLIASDAFFIPQNISRARTVGVESFVAWSPLTNLHLRLAYTWLPTAEDLGTDTRLLRRSKHTGSFNVSYRFLERFTVASTLTAVDDQPDLDPVTFGRATNAGYVRADVRLEAEICPNFSVHGRVENLTDEQYEPVLGYPALGRTVWGGATLRF